MKKFILLLGVISLIVSSGALSQSLTLSTANGPLNNNDSIMISGASTASLAAVVYVKNQSGSDGLFFVKKVELSIVPNSSNYFCWVQCYGPSVFVSPEGLTIPSGATVNNFSGDYDPLGNSGISVIRYVFFSKTSLQDTVCVNVLFNAGTLGVDDEPGKATFSPAYPNPAKSTVSFNYHLPSYAAGQTSLVIRNLLGSTVREVALDGIQGKVTLDVADLRKGVYFYSFIVSKQVFTTNKLVVE